MKKIILFCVLIVSVSLACAMPGVVTPVPIPTFDVNQLPTWVAQTAQVLALSATATNTSIPTNTPTRTPTSTSTATNTATFTLTPGTGTVSATPSRTLTATRTVTVSPTTKVTVTKTPTKTTATATLTPSKTPKTTPTILNVIVVTPTFTATASSTPTLAGVTPVVIPVSATSAKTCPEANTAFEASIIEIINAERANASLPALTYQSQLAAAAQLHSGDMACNNYFSHTALDGSDPSTRAARQGYSSGFVGENIAAGYSTPKMVVESWMNSPGHRANILGATYTEIGVGYAYSSNSSYGAYWTAVFGSPTP